MTWRIMKQGWQGCTHLLDTRSDTQYAYEELNGARYVSSDDDNGEVCFELPDLTIIWLMNADLETVEPFHDNYLREPHEDDYELCRYAVWWSAAGCLPDCDRPAFTADTLQEIHAWLQSDEADEYRQPQGEFSTYEFQIHDTDITQKESN